MASHHPAPGPKPGPDSGPATRRAKASGSARGRKSQATTRSAPALRADRGRIPRAGAVTRSATAGATAAGGTPLRAPVRAPRQERSRRTLQRLLAATEELLESQSFESITVADIVRAAGSSVGSFYARFPTKDSLLPALYERYDAEFRPRLEQAIERFETSDLGLADQARQTVEATVTMYRRRRWFMRAMALHARQHPETIGPDTRTHRTAFHLRLVGTFLRHREIIAHDDPEAAIGTAIFMTIAACRDKILFGEAPHASSYVTTDARLIEEMTRAFVAYLTAGPAAPAGPAPTNRPPPPEEFES